MSNLVNVDLFVEDRAHEEFLIPMIRRLACEEGLSVAPRARSARGGHGRALKELELYQDAAEKGIAGMVVPDLLVAARDGNCMRFTRARQDILSAIRPPFAGRAVVACPDPHVERWYLADPESFHAIVGKQPKLARKKCERDYYKRALATTVQQAGHPPTLGGIEFARELVENMDLYRAGRNDRSLRAFIEDLRSSLRRFRV